MSAKKSADLEAVKDKLLIRKAELEKILADMSSESGDDPQGQDIADQALSSSIDSLRQSLQEAEHEEYRKIVDALQAIEDGIYGTCIDCDDDISEKRLNHYPNASRCISCQEALEEEGG